MCSTFIHFVLKKYKYKIRNGSSQNLKKKIRNDYVVSKTLTFLIKHIECIHSFFYKNIQNLLRLNILKFSPLWGSNILNILIFSPFPGSRYSYFFPNSKLKYSYFFTNSSPGSNNKGYILFFFSRPSQSCNWSENSVWCLSVRTSSRLEKGYCFAFASIIVAQKATDYYYLVKLRLPSRKTEPRQYS